MPRLTGWLDRTLYPAYKNNWDDHRFREAILSHLRTEMEILDLGAGAGRVKQMNFRGMAARVVGIDPDPRVLGNPFLDEAHEGSGVRLPFAAQRFDMVFCDNVLEHVAEPDALFREVFRVLKPGGVFLAKTPNRFHYMTLVAQATPTVFHRFVNRMRGRPSEDTFPTLYRVNSPSAVRQYARRSGFEVEGLELVEGRPEYLRFNPISYIAGWLYERVVNSTDLFATFRIVLLVVLRKPPMA